MIDGKVIKLKPHLPKNTSSEYMNAKFNTLFRRNLSKLSQKQVEANIKKT